MVKGSEGFLGEYVKQPVKGSHLTAGSPLTSVNCRFMPINVCADCLQSGHHIQARMPTRFGLIPPHEGAETQTRVLRFPSEHLQTWPSASVRGADEEDMQGAWTVYALYARKLDVTGGRRPRDEGDWTG